jgi:hypothetical protein
MSKRQSFEEWQALAFAGGLGGGKAIAKMAWRACEASMRAEVSDLTTTDRHSAEELAKQFHDTYERLAPSFGYETRKASSVPWGQVPENNRKLMIAVCAEVWAEVDKRVADLRDELDSLKRQWNALQDYIHKTDFETRPAEIALARAGMRMAVARLAHVEPVQLPAYGEVQLGTFTIGGPTLEEQINALTDDAGDKALAEHDRETRRKPLESVIEYLETTEPSCRQAHINFVRRLLDQPTEVPE